MSMERAKYFEQLRQVSDAVKPVIEKYVVALQQKYKGICSDIFYLISERLKSNVLLLKPFLIKLSYELSGGKDWEKFVPVYAAAELINISSYQANSSFDGKNGITTQVERHNQFIASMITREIVADILHDITGSIIDYIQAEKIYHSLSESNKHIYLGQYYELNILTKDSFNIDYDFSFYLDLYIEKCKLLSGIFSGECAFIGGVLSDITEDDLTALKMFGINFGIGLHIVNEVGDFVPSYLISDGSLKKSFDQYSDLKKGKLTLPIMYILKFGDDYQKNRILNILGQHDVSQSDLEEATCIMINSGAYSFSKKIVKNFMKEAKDALHYFQPSWTRSLLSIMLSQLRSNKYFTNLRRFTNGC